MGRFRRPRTTWSRVSIETIASLLNENDFDYLEILDQLLVRKRRILVELGHGHGGQPGGGVELGRGRGMLAEHQGLEEIFRYFSCNIIFITVFTIHNRTTGTGNMDKVNHLYRIAARIMTFLTCLVANLVQVAMVRLGECEGGPKEGLNARRRWPETSGQVQLSCQQ